MSLTTQIEETEVRLQAALDTQIAGHCRIEAAGNKRQDPFLTPKRKSAQARYRAHHDEQVAMANLQLYCHIRPDQPNAGGIGTQV